MVVRRDAIYCVRTDAKRPSINATKSRTNHQNTKFGDRKRSHFFNGRFASVRTGSARPYELPFAVFFNDIKNNT